MTRIKYDIKKYKESNSGDFIPENWTVRKYKHNKQHRKMLVRKINGQVQKRVIKDLRVSPEISFGEARKIHKKRSKTARIADESKTSKNLRKRPDKAWKNNPSKYDIKSIDDKKGGKK